MRAASASGMTAPGLRCMTRICARQPPSGMCAARGSLRLWQVEQRLVKTSKSWRRSSEKVATASRSVLPSGPKAWSRGSDRAQPPSSASRTPARRLRRRPPP